MTKIPDKSKKKKVFKLLCTKLSGNGRKNVHSGKSNPIQWAYVEQ